jgi:hypothetical protein
LKAKDLAKEIMLAQLEKINILVCMHVMMWVSVKNELAWVQEVGLAKFKKLD